MNYCRRCGKGLTKHAGTLYICKNNHKVYTNPATCAGIFLVDANKCVVLAIRGIEPHKGMLDSIGGFLDPEETLEEGMYRELHEEVGLNKDQIGELQYLTSAVGHYAYSNESLPILSVFYWATLPQGLALKAQDDIAGLRIIKIADVVIDELHDDDVRNGIRALKQLFGVS